MELEAHLRFIFDHRYSYGDIFDAPQIFIVSQTNWS